MTEDAFKNEIKNPDRIQDFLNYVVCSSMILIGLFDFYKFFQSLTPSSNSNHLLYPAFFFLLLGGYGLWRISKDYSLIKVESEQTPEQKRQVIEEYITTLKVKTYVLDNELFKITYRNRYWNTVNVFITFDNEFYYLNAKAADYGSKGIIDFGLTNRASKKLQAYFMSKAYI